ncbi:MAG: lipopolysaccharide biosynthesis protein [Clostridiales bacterium]|nr:lipopolysaccharide biosynthesis protein [Clostridiales bacterium]
MSTETTTPSQNMKGFKRILLDNRNVERDGYIWNMAGSLVNAFQSVFLLMIINRVLGSTESGIFSIAYANASLFLNMGKYGMRYYQVSDVKHDYSFGEYCHSRTISSIAMIVTSVIYIIYSAITNNYSSYKTWVLICMCIFKVVDSFEDLYGGQYQNYGRLDVAGRIVFIRSVFLIVCYGLCICIFKDLLISLIITIIFNAISWIYMTVITYHEVGIKWGSASKRKVFSLLRTCFPLFAGAFLSFYIGNAPKYAIDAILSDDIQASYGFIAMPVFVVGLLNSFIFNPQIVGMTEQWQKGETREFVSRVIKQVLIVIILTVICIVGAYLLGVPVLSWLYATDLAPYKTDLLILLVGGGFLGLTGLLNAAITIIRFQKVIAWGYLAVAVLALAFSNRIVNQYGIRGATVLYTILMALTSLAFAIILVIGIIKNKNKGKEVTAGV